ncbi:putative transmembrane protein [Phytophthora cinnamomi]|uniref:putative transmembrane protein n=1 Tax=Phytophthora cinnamomi TaxID=4785 RepID=UPI00355A6988|nr:putative transmembrane protein [Phytophthora cinnamomi]
MQFEPPTKEADVTVNIVDGDNSTGGQGVDSNGIVTGRWKTGIFGFTDSMVPNGVMSCCCPGVVVAQISARLGLMPFYHVLGIFGGLYLVTFIAAVADSDFFDFLFWLCSVIAVLCLMRLRWRIRTLFSIPGSHAEDAAFSLCCGCCSVAQMASHVESYEPGTFSFAPRTTLQGYSLN